MVFIVGRAWHPGNAVEQSHQLHSRPVRGYRPWVKPESVGSKGKRPLSLLWWCLNQSLAYGGAGGWASAVCEMSACMFVT